MIASIYLSAQGRQGPSQQQLSATNSAPAQAGGVRREERLGKEGSVGLEQPPSMQGQGVPRDRMLSTSDSQQLFVGNLPHDCTEENLEDQYTGD